jgi:hypothetical protein
MFIQMWRLLDVYIAAGLFAYMILLVCNDIV